MSSNIDLETQVALDAAIRMLYKSRPAKAAALLGLVDTPEQVVKLSMATGNHTSAFNSLNKSPQAVNLGPIKGGLKGSAVVGDNSQQLNVVTPASKLDFSRGSNTLTTPTNNLGSIAKGSSIDQSTGMAKMNSLYKRAMTEAELIQYYGGAGDLMGTPSEPSITPSQMGMLGAGGVGLTVANRGRAKNVASRELRSIRDQYLEAVQAGNLNKQRLKLLNKELKLRGARPTLSLAPTMGIADAQMIRAERDLGSKILKRRYKGAIPMIAASLLGATAYNQFS